MSSTTSTQLRYPAQLQVTDNTDYLSFGFYKYYPAFRKRGIRSDRVDNYNQTVGATGTENKGTASFWSANEATRKQQKLNSPAGNFGKKDGPEILIYMPPDVSTSFAADWGGKEMGNAAAGLTAASANTQAGDMAGVIDNALAGVANIGALSQSVAARLTKEIAAASGTSLTMNDTLAGTTGTILNPNVEVLFGGPKLRNVSFSFKMAARNLSEAKTIHAICTAFKKNALPGFGATNRLQDSIAAGFTAVATGLADDKSDNMGKHANFIEVPNLVMVKYMKGNTMHPYLSQYKSCALTNVDINYTPDGVYSTSIDAYPTAVELRIGLVETKLVYSQEIGEQKDETAKGETANNENIGRTWSY
tara:strand:+ start:7296 stop:8381 length:1086 start_codon:yes stop_codon:yes gene_type:complete